MLRNVATTASRCIVDIDDPRLARVVVSAPTVQPFPNVVWQLFFNVEVPSRVSVQAFIRAGPFAQIEPC